MSNSSEYRASEWVQVRSKEEILRTLDKSGQLEGLPFMPEMEEFCGRRFRVLKRAHKTCDPPNGLGGRRMLHAVHLAELRCSGAAHDGCQARCLLFWKDAWLNRIGGDTDAGVHVRQHLAADGPHVGAGRGCTAGDIVAGTRSRVGHPTSDEPIYICQSTQLAQATKPLRWWDLRQYVEDYKSGNVRLSEALAGLILPLYSQMVSAGLGLGSALRWIYDSIQRTYGGTPYPLRLGEVPRGARTPSIRLDLQAGDLVEVRKYKEILSTITEEGHNRGMIFDAEMVPYCGGTYRVLARVSKIIDEKTGKMRYLKNDCIMLDGVVCRASYARYRRFCPRSIYPYWREIWLRRVAANTSGSGQARNQTKFGFD
jgi:hypothetical protein